jgi:hypothetical protein
VEDFGGGKVRGLFGEVGNKCLGVVDLGFGVGSDFGRCASASMDGCGCCCGC